MVRFHLIRYKGGIIGVLKRKHGVVASAKTMMIWKHHFLCNPKSKRMCFAVHVKTCIDDDN